MGRDMIHITTSASPTFVGGAAPTVPPPDASIAPGGDFYKYINNRWQRHIHLPSFSGSFGVSEEIEMDVRETLLSAIDRLCKEKPDLSLSKLARSVLHTASQRNSVIDLQRVLNTFDCISNHNDVAQSIGALNKIQSRSPLSLVIAPDAYKSDTCVVYLYEPSLGLPDKIYYKADSHNRIILKYKHFLETVGEKMNIESLEQAITIETGIIPFLTNDRDDPSPGFSYFPYSLSKLSETYPRVPWESMFHGWGLDRVTMRSATYIIKNPRYIAGLNRMFNTFAFETWRIWMRAQAILSFVEFLPPPFDDLHYELFGKALKGTAEKLPQKFLMLNVLQNYVKHDLGKVFVGLAVPKGTKARATNLVKRLIEATVARLRRSTWMDLKTRDGAIEKVQAMNFQVAFPEKFKSETAEVDIHPERPLLNILNLAEHDTREMIVDLRRHRCGGGDDWEDGVFEVNAYYYAEGNRMVIPAGMLRKPFFDLRRSDAWNLGGIGVAIGHEITHGFDEDGRLYDKHGNYNSNWWTEKDSKQFKKMTRAVVNLFDGADYMGGKVDGVNTLSENLADLGGLAIALEALNGELVGLSERVKKDAWREFFTSYAVSWRNKERPRKAKQSLLLDVHAPAPLRVNLIVRQFAEFYDAFDIHEGEPGWTAPELRVQLW